MADNIAPEAIAQALKQVMGQVNVLTGQNGVAAQAMPPAQGAPSMMPAPVQQPAYQNGVPNPTGWSLPLETEINGMSITVYVQFPAETFPQYQQIIDQMVRMGYQVRGFQRSSNNGGSSWGGNRGGSWANRGGYPRRY